jgi:prophage regulatory protein
MAKSFIRLPSVQSRTGKSKSSIYLDVNQGTFPKPVSIGGGRGGRGSVAWIDTEIDEWIENRIALSRLSAQDHVAQESSR